MSKKNFKRIVPMALFLLFLILGLFLLLKDKSITNNLNNTENNISKVHDYKYYSDQIQNGTSDAQIYFERAKIARTQGIEYDKILSDLNQAIKLNPNNFEYYFTRADIKSFNKDYTSAIYDINKAKELKNNNEELIYLESQVLKGLGKSEQALGNINILINSNGKVSKYFELRGDIKVSLNDFIGAINDLDKAIELGGISGTYYLRGLSKFKIKDYNGALSDVNKSISMYSSLNSFNLKGKILMHLGKYNEAKIEYDALLKNTNLSKDFLGSIYSSLGEIHIENKDYIQALKYLNKSIDLGNKDSYYLRGKLYLIEKKYNSALNDFLNSNKDSNEINYYLGIAYFYLNNNTAACSNFALGIKSGDTKSVEEFNKSCK